MKRFLYLTLAFIVLGSLAWAQMYESSAMQSVRYEIMPIDNSGVSGSVLISDYANETVVVILVTGTPAGGDHPAHFHAGNVGSGGDVVVPLNNVSGATGLSVTVTDTPYNAIIDGDHYVNVHLSPDDIGTIVASGEVGAGATPMSDMVGMSDSEMSDTDMGDANTGVNEEEFDTLTTIEYVVSPVNNSGVDGIVQITEKTMEEGGGSRVTISLEGTPDGGVHPAHFHLGDCGSGGAIVIPLNDVDGTEGSSVTDVDATVEQITSGDHYLNIHLSPSDMGTIVACGEVGAGVDQ